MSRVRTGVEMGILLGLVLSALLWVAAQPAHAQTVVECQAEIAELKVQTQNTTFIGQSAAKDQAGLIGKLFGQHMREGRIDRDKLVRIRSVISTASREIEDILRERDDTGTTSV